MPGTHIGSIGAVPSGSYFHARVLPCPVGNCEDFDYKSASIIDTNYSVLDELGFNLYPNPTNSDLTIELDNEIGEQYEIFIYDITGRSLLYDTFNGRTNVIDVRKFVQGSYLLTLKTPNNIGYKKFIKL
ncbi:MAG: T9SS type A sorting domain-containing protein [Candidatus Delongbacteria bacterium]|nr:T9SS type A sorting domain-containing protein [Candidatus Delongbacteria bacterium]